MGKKILVTGSNGFIGSRLVQSLTGEGAEVSGAPDLDLFDFESIESALKTRPWDVVVHLAAVSHVEHCERDPSTAFRTNLGGTALMLEGVRRHCPKTHFIFASSAQVYAPPQNVGEGAEVWTEDRLISPRNVYATAKWQAEMLIADFANRSGAQATVLRLFNHTHRFQDPDFFLPYLYSQMKDHPKDKPLKISVGNLDLYRDIGSLGDLLSAFSHAVNLEMKRGSQTFNICSGEPKHLSTVAREMAAKVGLSVEFVTDPDRVRANEPKSVCGSHDKFTRLTGWRPTCRTERDLVEAFFE